MSEANKELIRKMLAGADANDIGVLEEVLADDYVDHNPPPFQGPETGLAGARDGFTVATKIFSDWRHEVLAQYADGDIVITRVVGRGKHTGEMMGFPASNNEVSMEGIAIHRIANGKIAEHWGQVDAAGLLMQMGAFPPPG